MTKSERVSARLTPDQLGYLKRLGAHYRWSMAETVANLIEFSARVEKAHKVARAEWFEDGGRNSEEILEAFFDEFDKGVHGAFVAPVEEGEES